MDALSRVPSIIGGKIEDFQSKLETLKEKKYAARAKIALEEKLSETASKVKEAGTEIKESALNIKRRTSKTLNEVYTTNKPVLIDAKNTAKDEVSKRISHLYTEVKGEYKTLTLIKNKTDAKHLNLSNYTFTDYTQIYEGKLKQIAAGLVHGKTPLINKGACESRIFFNVSGEAIGIFKDLTPQGVSLKRTAEIAIKKFLNMRRPTELLPGGVPESKGYAEKIAYDLDKHLGFNIVPETNLIHKPLTPGSKEGTIGSLQLFVKGHEEAKKIFMSPERSPDEAEKFLFQKFAVFDYLIGNLDRHEENWMVEVEKPIYDNETGELKNPVTVGRLLNIAVIDNGNSFIEQNPNSSDKTILKNQYKWGEHSYSKPEFTQETIKFVQNLDEQKIRYLFEGKKELLKGLPHTETFFSDKMIENTLERLAVLKKCVVEGQTPETLSKIKTGEQIEAFLNPSHKVSA